MRNADMKVRDADSRYYTGYGLKAARTRKKNISKILFLDFFRLPLSEFRIPTSAFRIPNSAFFSDHSHNLCEFLLQPLLGDRECGFKLLGKNGHFIFLEHPEKFLERPALFNGCIG
jgi:hypothetical protein